MTAVRDATIAARVPMDLRTDLEALSRRAGDDDLSVTIRRLLRRGVDEELAGARTRRQGAALFAGGTIGAARRAGPATSKAAARDVAPRAGSQRRRALERIVEAGDAGATTDEVIAALEGHAFAAGTAPPAVNGVARRVTDLLQAGAITEARVNVGIVAPHGEPLTRMTRHGAQATVYIATAKGRRWLDEARA